MQNFVLIDILPFVGDTGVRDLPTRAARSGRRCSRRRSRRRRGPTIYYSTSGNPCRAEVGGPTVPGCDPPNWTTVAPDPITSVRSFKVEFGSRVVGPFDSLDFFFSMTTPGNVPAGDLRLQLLRLPGGPRRRPRLARRRAAEGRRLARQLRRGEPRRLRLGGHQPERHPGRRPDRPQRRLRPSLHAGHGRHPRHARRRPALLHRHQRRPRQRAGLVPLPGPRAGQLLRLLHAAADVRRHDAEPGGGRQRLRRQCRPRAARRSSPSRRTRTIRIDRPRPVATQLAALGDYVWFDRNSDGVQNESPFDGANGVTVRLFLDDGDGNPEPGTGDVLVATTVTADDVYGQPGYYLFDGLVPGLRYFVQFVRPASATAFTTQNAGGDDDRRLRRPSRRRRDADRDPRPGRGEPDDRRRPDHRRPAPSRSATRSGWTPTTTASSSRRTARWGSTASA